MGRRSSKGLPKAAREAHTAHRRRARSKHRTLDPPGAGVETSHTSVVRPVSDDISPIGSYSDNPSPGPASSRSHASWRSIGPQQAATEAWEAGGWRPSG